MEAMCDEKETVLEGTPGEVGWSLGVGNAGGLRLEVEVVLALGGRSGVEGVEGGVGEGRVVGGDSFENAAVGVGEAVLLEVGVQLPVEGVYLVEAFVVGPEYPFLAAEQPDH